MLAAAAAVVDSLMLLILPLCFKYSSAIAAALTATAAVDALLPSILPHCLNHTFANAAASAATADVDSPLLLFPF